MNLSPATSIAHLVISASAFGPRVARNLLTISSYSFHLSPFIFSEDAPAVGYMGGWSVVLLLPLEGIIFSWASTSAASEAKSESLSFSRTDLRFRLLGYSVFSVRG